ncbi:MAG: hypothetical protein J2P37_31015 [Ktedonobacteraceae bacterium]|nr:hypothetical protein [Ktedonobacteraceae bacterium]
MQKERLNVYLNPDISSAVRALAGDEEQNISTVAQELMTLGLSIKKGEIIEQQSLPVIRDIVQYELLQAMTQLRLAWKEDMRQIVIEEMKATARKSDNRIMGFLARLLRDSGIIRRLVYALLLHFIGEKNALIVYKDAQEKAGRDLAPSTTTEE